MNQGKVVAAVEKYVVMLRHLFGTEAARVILAWEPFTVALVEVCKLDAAECDELTLTDTRAATLGVVLGRFCTDHYGPGSAFPPAICEAVRVVVTYGAAGEA